VNLESYGSLLISSRLVPTGATHRSAPQVGERRPRHDSRQKGEHAGREGEPPGPTSSSLHRQQRLRFEDVSSQLDIAKDPFLSPILDERSDVLDATCL
jgi:hypothetical protein